MSTRRAVGGGPPARRPPSQGRIKAFLQRNDAAPGSQGPSTLPPPPFESEAELEGLEWWLGAHMNLASSLLWLEQHHGDGTEPPSSHRTDSHLDAMREMVAQAAAVRDALYELYCDAADRRLESLTSRGGILEVRVRASYQWCEGVVALLGRLSADLRAGTVPDWTEARATYRGLAGLYPGTGDDVREAVKALGIDFSSPVEPLRGLLHDIDQLLTGMNDFHATLAKRFS
jgi:hypothetical protein